MSVADRFLSLLILSIFILVIALGTLAFAEHPAEHMEIHNRFYKTWMMPDNRNVSCCHDEDCAPAEAYQKNGRWYARKEGDTGDFTPVPPQKVEQDRDSPDGRSHICGRRYGWDGGQLSVFCFIAGSGS